MIARLWRYDISALPNFLNNNILASVKYFEVNVEPTTALTSRSERALWTKTAENPQPDDGLSSRRDFRPQRRVPTLTIGSCQ
jgi:hypothetical protein